MPVEPLLNADTPPAPDTPPQPPAADTATPPPAPPASPASPEWLSAFEGVDADIAGDPVLAKYKNPAEAVKALVHAQRALGKKTVQSPGPDASDEDRAAFYTALGRPDSPDGYEWEPPEGFEFNREEVAPYIEEMHKIGLTSDQFKGVMDLEARRVADATTAMAAQAEAAANEQRSQAEVALKEEWGDAFAAKVRAAGKVAKDNGILQKLVEAGVANDPDVIKFLANMAGTRAEDNADHDTPPATASAARQRIDTLRSALKDMSEGTEQYRDTQIQIERMYAIAYPD